MCRALILILVLCGLSACQHKASNKAYTASFFKEYGVDQVTCVKVNAADFCVGMDGTTRRQFVCGSNGDCVYWGSSNEVSSGVSDK